MAISRFGRAAKARLAVTHKRRRALIITPLLAAIVAALLQTVAIAPADATSIVHVQTAGNTNGTSSSISQAFSSNNTAGNTIVAAFSWDGTRQVSCSDTRGNTYVTVVNRNDEVASQALGICYATNIAAGANTVTVSFGTAASFRHLIIHEYSGIATSSTVDVTSTNAGITTTGANAITSSAATTTSNGDLIFGAVIDTTSATTISAGTGFTQRNSLNGKDFATQDRTQTTAGSIASTQTFGNANQRYVAGMVAFRPSGAVAPPPPTTPSYVQTMSASNSAQTTTFTEPFASPVTAGNAIVVAVSWDGTASLTCTDTQGNAFTTAITRVDTVNNQSLAICYALNVAGGDDTFTANFSVNSGVRYMLMHEYAGIATANAADGTASNTAAATTVANNVTSGSATTTTNGDLIFGAAVDTAATTSIAPGTGFTQRGFTDNKTMASQDLVQTTAGVVASTQTFGNTHRYAAALLALKPKTATPPATSPTFVQSPTGASSAASATTIASTFALNNVGGNAVVAAYSWTGTSNATCSDSRGNTYATAVTRYDGTSNRTSAICYAVGIAPGPNTVTVTFAAASANRRLLVQEYAGIAASSALGGTASNAATGTTAANNVTSTAATTTSGGQLIFGSVLDATSTTAITAGTGFTQRNSLNGKDFATQDQTQTTAGSIASTQTFGAAHRYIALMATFRPNATAPVASFTATTSNGANPLGVSVDASASTAPAGATIAAYSWNFGDSATATGVTATHTYAAPGTYTITLTVTDSNAQPGTTTRAVTVYSAPAASFTVSKSLGNAPMSVNFDAGASTSPSGGIITTYAWDFGDGSNGTGVTTTHVYNTVGTFTATLTITDSHNNTATTTRSVTTIAAPVARMTASPTNGSNPLTVSFDASTSSASSPATIASYSWNFGDGTTASGPTASHTYTTTGAFTATLTVTDSTGGTGTATHAISVNTPPVAAFSAMPNDVDVEHVIVFDSTASSATNSTITQWAWTFGDGGTSTTQNPHYAYSTAGTYTVGLTVTDASGGTATTTHTVTVHNTPTAAFTYSATGTAPIDMTFDGSSSTVDGGAIASYTWNFGDGATGTGVNPTHRYENGGSFDVSLTITDARGGIDVLTRTLTINGPPVLNPPPLDNTTPSNTADQISFLFDGSNPVQQGVDKSKMDDKRLALVRGRVLDKNNAPIANVTVGVTDHPEFGTTQTQADGWFSLAVNGGTQLRLHFDATGLLRAERVVNPKWDDSVVMDDLVMIPEDGAATTVSLSGVPANDFVVAQATPQTDADGTRTNTLLVPAGVSATAVKADGSTVPLPTMTIHQTEYTVGTNGEASMPAPLPQSSAYTYAFELTADQAEDVDATGVTFNKPLWHYNDNFLDFPAGTVVPNGYLDPKTNAWVPADNGLVIKVLSVTGGVAQVDINGDDVADTGAALDAIGLTNDELTKLATLYTPGKSLWRSPIKHFSAWDSNWGISPPSDADNPFTRFAKKLVQFVAPDCMARGSNIGCESQTLGEDVGIAGTGLDLNYASNRQAGYQAQNRIDMQVSGATVPASLKRIEVDVTIAGRKYVQNLPAQANQNFTFTWDGNDAFGRPLQGAQPATVRVGYVYDGQYQKTEKFGYNGNGAIISGDKARGELTLWSTDQTLTLSAATVSDARGQGLGGWLIAGHQDYDPRAQILADGDGHLRQVLPTLSSISTFAGTGEQGSSGNGGQAAAAKMFGPGGMAFDAAGNLYLSDTYNDRIRKIAVDGTITNVAGTGTPGFSGDGGAATSAQLHSPLEMTFDKAGNLYFADVDNNRVRRIDTNGVITTIAGTGVLGSTGDGGLATAATLAEPTSVALDENGDIFITEFRGNRIREITGDGIISTYAGTGAAGFSGDGAKATAAQLNQPAAIVVDHNQTIFFTDSANERVRRITKNGIIDTIAGNGTHGYGGDNGPATSAQLADPDGIAIDLDGSIVVADRDNDRVRKINTDGSIITIAGSGVYGFSGDNGPATQAMLANPRSVTVDQSGRLYVADADNNRIRRIGPPLPSATTGAFTVPSQDGTALYKFDSNGLHTQTYGTLTGALLITYQYDSAGRLISIVDPQGNHTDIVRDANGVATSIVAPFGQITTLQMNADGYLSKITNGNNESVSLGYQAGGLLTSYTDPNNNSSSYTYGLGGLLTSTTGRDGKTTTLTPTDLPDGRRVVEITPTGHTATFEIHQLTDGSLQHNATQVDGTTESEVYSPDGTQTLNVNGIVTKAVLSPDTRFGMSAPISTTSSIVQPGQAAVTSTSNSNVVLSDPSNPLSVSSRTDTATTGDRTWTSTYTASNRTIVSTTPEGRHTTSTLDAFGRTVSEQAGDFVPSTYHYDTHGRVDSATQGSGPSARTTSIFYNAAGFVDHVVTPDNQTVSYTYDAAGRVTSSTGPNGQTYATTYDANGNANSVTPPGKPTYTIGRHPETSASSFTAPSVAGGGTGYTYDINDDLQYSGYTGPDGTHVTFTYNSRGQLTAIVAPGVTTSYAFGSDGRFNGSTSQSGVTESVSYTGVIPTSLTYSGPIPGTISSVYDSEMRTTSDTVDGNTVTYGYDRDGLMNRAGDLNMSLNAADGYVSGTGIGQVGTSMSLDSFGQLSQYTASTGSGQVFNEQVTGYDKAGRITDKTEVISGVTRHLHYTYDATGRLLTSSVDGTPIGSYNYDSNNNRTSVNGSTAVFDDQDRITSQGASTYGYDLTGNLTTGNGSTYNYTLSKLTSVDLANGHHVTYALDASGNRIQKKVDGTAVSGYLYDGSSIVALTDGSGNLTERFVYGTSGTPDYFTKNGQTYRIVTDHLGSVRLVINTSDGSVAQRLDYDDYGKVLIDTNPGFQPFGFAGGLYDQDTGIIHFGLRDYDPTTGRFMEKDLIGFEGGSNAYVYANGDPINMVDPSGTDPVGCVADVFSYIPGPIGEVATVVLAADYLAHGDWVGAGIIAGSMLVPLSPGIARKALTSGVAKDVERGAEESIARDVERKTTSSSDACLLNSFDADTQVTMADGSTKPISEVKVGDQVLATDPDSGKTYIRTVTDTMINNDNDLRDVVVVDDAGQSQTLKATDHHRFWDVSQNRWVEAVDLLVGDRLREANGQLATVASTSPRPGVANMFDLTVDITHTFYVSSGASAVLVHNCGVDLDDLSTLHGADPQDVRQALQDHPDWSGPLPVKQGTSGEKFTHNTKKGEQIILNDGYPNATDPVHGGPYAKVARNGDLIRIPLKGNPAL